jgi:nucleotide-binding universal stress UspA family protein
MAVQNPSIRSIAHPTDFSDLSGVAFAHALRIALATRSKLHLLHVVPQDTGAALAFPHVRQLLVQWGLAEQSDPPWVVASELGIEVDTTRIKWEQPAQGVLSFLREQPCDLLVLATHGGEGIEHWLRGSVSEIVSRHSAIPSLFLAPGARGFVSPVSGELQLRRALVPIDYSPRADKAIEAARRLAALLTGGGIVLHLVHVGSSAPPLPATSAGHHLPPVMLRHGNVASTIVDVAIEFEVDLIAMPTAGHRNPLDLLRGSTTERVIRHAPCPVLAIPAA